MLDDRNLRFDLFALGLLAFSIFLGLSLITYSPADPLGEALFPLNRIYSAHQVEYPLNQEVHNACGHAGALCADMAFRLFGWGAFYALGWVLGVDIWLLMRRPISGGGTRLFGWLISFVAGLTFIQMFASGVSIGPIVGPGGYLGAMGRVFLESHFATLGSLILLGTVILGGVMLCTDYVLLHIGLLVATALINAIPRQRIRFRRGSMARRRKVASSVDEQEEIGEEWDAEEEEYEEDPELDESFMRTRGRLVSDLTHATDLPEDIEDEYEAEGDEEWEDDELEYDEDELEEDEAESEDATTDSDESAPATARSKGKPDKHAARAEVMAKLDEASRDQDPQDYELPPMELLNESQKYNVEQLTKEVKRKATMLEKTFEDFNLEVKVVDIETGPVIAQYEVALKRGLRLSKITGLADDLAIALRVPSVRIVAPIPGKNTVGIEVPNDDRQVVRLREVMEETNGRVRKMSIPIYLGKDVSGNPLAVDLAKLPHLLIAGRTGTGKSVCLNSIISSMLMTKTPDDVRLLMIDPKMVELSGYSRLPHLMHPVVTDMRKAEAILAWACEKMDERYQLLARAGVRHITSYNQLGEEELMERLQPDSDDEAKMIPRHLPFIVIVADEMADLMMTAGKEVEAHIIRLAAKSRAVGIHLILATQKPTVDVITGLIKSNLPARIAFQVASKQDSRVVLDENGADKLLGYGDMLLLSPGTSTLLRGQGTFMSDDEIDRIVEYCGSHAEQNFVRELVQLKVDEPESGEVVPLKKRDELYEEAIEIVIREGRGSVSLLQRNLQIGYGRAARLIDFMAEDGIVGAYNGSQAREVLMTLADWNASRQSSEQPAADPPKTAFKMITAPKSVNDELEEELAEDELESDDEELGLEEEYEDELEDEEDELEEEYEDELEGEEDELEEEYEDELEGEEDELEEEYEDELEGEEDELEEEYEDELEDEEGELEEEEDEVAADLDEEDDADTEWEEESEYEDEAFEQSDYDEVANQAGEHSGDAADADEAVASEHEELEYEDVAYEGLEYEDVEDEERPVKRARRRKKAVRRADRDASQPRSRKRKSAKKVVVHASHLDS